MDSGSRNPFTLKAGIAEEQSCKGTLLTNHCQLRRFPRPGLCPLERGDQRALAEAVPSILPCSGALPQGKGRLRSVRL